MVDVATPVKVDGRELFQKMTDKMEDYGLKPLWDAVLPVYLAFRRVCERHGLRHWAAFGTALGVARHKGFIPWDDDFDVMMPRADYEIFMEVAQLKLPAHLKVVNFKNTDGYPWLFGKVQNVDKANLTNLEKCLGRTLPQGIYIDILPCDGYPSIWWSRAKRWFHGIALCARREYCTCPKWKRNRIRRRIMIELGRFLGYWFKGARTVRDFVSANDGRMKTCSFDDAKHIITCGVRFSLGLTGNVYPADIFRSGTIEMPFMDITVPMLTNWEGYLEIEYGDWRKLPPIDCRILTHSGEDIAPWR